MREALRVKETNLRRVEQEVDSLGFRNKQLEHRVAALQDDLSAVNDKKQAKSQKIKSKSNADTSTPVSHQTLDASIFGEELQKKIFECAQLTSMVADKTSEIHLQEARIDELEQLIRTMNDDHMQSESKMRKEIERLVAKTHELEAKSTEASSMVGSDDTLYVSECEQHQKALNNNCNNNNSSGSSSNGKHEDRLSVLEKEMVYWRTQYEVLQITAKINEKQMPSSIDTNKTIEMDENQTEASKSVEQLISAHYSKKIEELFMKKCMAESKLAIYIEEVSRRHTQHFHFAKCIRENSILLTSFLKLQCDSLQRHLEIVSDELKDEQKKLSESQRNLQLADEDLVCS